VPVRSVPSFEELASLTLVRHFPRGPDAAFAMSGRSDSFRASFPEPGRSAMTPARPPRRLAPLLPLVASAALLGGGVPGVAAQDPHGASMTAEVVEGEDFRVYDAEGRARSFAHILEALDEADAVLVGESHDDRVGHGVEAQLLVRAAQRFGAVEEGGRRPVVLSLEMFERDVQYILDEYLAGLITEDQFLASARPWDRYRTDYRPMVEFARAHGLPVVAANAPRRYINRVSRLGPASLAELPEEARRFLPPLPFPGPSRAYRQEWDAVMAEMMAEAADGSGAEAVGDARPEDPHEETEPSPHDPPGEEPATHDTGYALYAQALWDAAMGEAVAHALEARPGALVVHFAGSFHVARGTGIPERLPEYRPGTRVLTVVLRPVDDILAWEDEEHEELADFVVLTRKGAAVSPHGFMDAG